MQTSFQRLPDKNSQSLSFLKMLRHSKKYLHLFTVLLVLMMQKIDGFYNEQLLLFKNDVLISFTKSKYILMFKLSKNLTPMTRSLKALMCNEPSTQCFLRHWYTIYLIKFWFFLNGAELRPGQSILSRKLP